MILTPGTFSDDDLQTDAARVCPHCDMPMQSVVVVIAHYRPAQTSCVCLACSYAVLNGGAPAVAWC
jgi:hypothetical protein